MRSMKAAFLVSAIVALVSPVFAQVHTLKKGSVKVKAVSLGELPSVATLHPSLAFAEQLFNSPSGQEIFIPGVKHAQIHEVEKTDDTKAYYYSSLQDPNGSSVIIEYKDAYLFGSSEAKKAVPGYEKRFQRVPICIRGSPLTSPVNMEFNIPMAVFNITLVDLLDQTDFKMEFLGDASGSLGAPNDVLGTFELSDFQKMGFSNDVDLIRADFIAEGWKFQKIRVTAKDHTFCSDDHIFTIEKPEGAENTAEPAAPASNAAESEGNSDGRHGNEFLNERSGRDAAESEANSDGRHGNGFLNEGSGRNAAESEGNSDDRQWSGFLNEARGSLNEGSGFLNDEDPEKAKQKKYAALARQSMRGERRGTIDGFK